MDRGRTRQEHWTASHHSHAGTYPDTATMYSTCVVAAAVCVSSSWLSPSQLAPSWLWPSQFGVESDKDMEMDSSSRRNVGSISRSASRSSSRRPLDEAGSDLRVDRVRTRTRLEASADAVHSAARAKAVEVFMVINGAGADDSKIMSCIFEFVF